jgi:hypothetical protein
MRLRDSMPATEVGQPRAGRVIGVLDQVAGFLDAARAEVERDHRLQAGATGPHDELVEPDLVRLD